MRFWDGWALPLAALLMFAGVAHLVAPGNFDGIVPHVLPGSGRWWTLGSGAVEIGLAMGVLSPATRRAAATLTAIFFVLVFPANIQMAVDWASRSDWEFLLALLRLPLQIPLVWWAWHVRNRTVPEHDRPVRRLGQGARTVH